MNAEEIVAEASKLPESERALVASDLIQTLEIGHHSISDEEVARRVEEAEKDPGVLISFEELVRGLKRSGN